MKTKMVLSSGNGPEEARRFVAMLSRRMILLCAEQGLEIREVSTFGDPRAPRSVRILVNGDARTLLSEEVGTHALLSRSGRNGRRSRKRWFATIELTVEAHGATALNAPIHEQDLELQAFRSRGPGGQHVNKTSSGVRLRHRATGIVTQATEERSQHANRRIAMEKLRQEIASRSRRAEVERKEAEWTTHHRIERGNAVRTYRENHHGELELANG